MQKLKLDQNYAYIDWPVGVPWRQFEIQMRKNETGAAFEERHELRLVGLREELSRAPEFPEGAKCNRRRSSMSEQLRK